MSEDAGRALHGDPVSEQTSLHCDGGAGALHLSASLSPFLSVSPSLLSGFGLGPAMASGLAVLRMELLHLWGPMGVHGPACWVVFPLCQKQG